MAELAQWFLENGKDAPVIIYLVGTITTLATALYKEWLILGKTYHTLLETSQAQSEKLTESSEKLTTQLILNEGVSKTLAFRDQQLAEAHEDIHALEVRLARAEGRRAPSKRAST